MNKVLEEFNKKLKEVKPLLSAELQSEDQVVLNGTTLEDVKAGSVLIKYDGQTFFTMRSYQGIPAIDIPEMALDQRSVQWFVDLVKLCGEYLNVLVKED